MTLAPGTRLGPYEIVAPLGAGGMGEVYKALDTRLQREVAVKVLRDSFSNDPDRLRRFEQEARAAGALNHPNITAVYDIGSSEGSLYVVSELLEGESLGTQVARGPVPPRKAVDYALQIAQGLAAAHEKGIVHRDLKPDNVFVTKSGRVKLLDFGLAKLAAPEPRGDRPGSLPSSAVTEPGVVLGTLAYMSPEQVRGLPADYRSDLFSFGAILYEMLSGSRAFGGFSAADTISAILKEDPPELSATSPRIPAALEQIVRHCLEKNPEERFRSAHDLAFALQTVFGSSTSGSAPFPAVRRRGNLWRRARLDLVAALVLGLVGGALLDRRLRPRPASEIVTFRPLTYSGRDLSPAASPDGRTIAFASERDGVRRIWLKQLSGGNEAALTSSGHDDTPRFSPDGSTILFSRTQGQVTSLYKVPMLGGEPRKLVENTSGGDWSPDGREIAFLRPGLEKGIQSSAVFVANADGSAPREITRFEGQALRWPRWSPDGRTILLVDSGLAGAARVIHLVEVAGGAKRVIRPPDDRPAVSAAWTGDGRELVYSQAIRGGGVEVIRHRVAEGRSDTILSLPANSGIIDALGPGKLLFETVSARENLREIAVAGMGGSSRWLSRGSSAERQPIYSPDGEWVVFTSSRTGNLDLWSLSLKSGTVRRLTEDGAADWDPALTRDGTKLVWSSGRSGHLEIWMADADGSGARRVTDDGVDAQNPTPTPDGRWIFYNSGNPAKLGIWKVRSDGTGAARLIAGTTGLPEVSPDGQYVAYIAGVAGGTETIRVVRTSDGSPAPFEIRIPIRRPAPVRIGRPRWMPDGRAIAFVGQNEEGVHGIFVQDFVPGRDTSSTRRELGGFDPESETESFGISPDGSRMVIASWERIFSVMEAEGVSQIAPPVRNPK